MADEIKQIITAVRDELVPNDRTPIVNSYLDIVESTIDSQHQIIMNYEELVKKLENQIIQCQQALDESTKREIDQIKLIMELKLQLASQGQDDDEEGQKPCSLCKDIVEENQLLMKQNEQQSEVIDKLSQAQELLMLQYKILEMGMDKELANIAEQQKELEAMKTVPQETDQDAAAANVNGATEEQNQ